jgi:hypothetical protein
MGGQLHPWGPASPLGASFTPGGQLHPWGPASPLGSISSPSVEVKNGPLQTPMLIYVGQWVDKETISEVCGACRRPARNFCLSKECAASHAGLPDGINFCTKNHNLGIFWRPLECKMFVHFMVIWYTYFKSIKYIFSYLVYFVVIWKF